MDKIACNIELFCAESPVFIYKNGKIVPMKIPSDEAASKLAFLCHKEDIYDLQLSGDKAYLEGFVENLATEETVQYGINKIRIEVME